MGRMRKFLIASMLATVVTAAADQPRQCAILGNVIDGAYRQILERNMTADELSRGTRSIGSGAETVSDLVRNIVLSDEYQSRLKGLPPADQAESLYRHILGRAAGADLDAAVELIGTHGIRATAISLMNSPEYRERFGRSAVPASPTGKAKALCQ